MKQTNRIKRLLSLALTAAVLLGVVLPVNGTEPELQALRFQKVDSGSVSAELRQDVAAEIQVAGIRGHRSGACFYCSGPKIHP